MAKKKTLRKRAEDYLYDHPVQRAVLSHGWTTLVTIVSAFFFAFGFRAFLAPSNIEQIGSLRLVSGGISGFSQTIISFIELLTGHAISKAHSYDIVYSIFYFSLNIPVFILAWIGIGKRFSFYTLLNVLLCSLFTSLLRYFDASVFDKISTFVNANGGFATRAILAGVCTGISSSIAFRVDASAGGIDVVAYFIALRKSRLVGRYSVYMNFLTVSLYTLIMIIDVGWGTELAAQVFVATLLSILYQFVVMFVIDSINTRNKKYKIEAISDMADLGKVIVGTLPHGATIVKGEGAFSGSQKYIVTVIVSAYEVKQATKIIREADPAAFVQITQLSHVYGRFFLPPIR